MEVQWNPKLHLAMVFPVGTCSLSAIKMTPCVHQVPGFKVHVHVSSVSHQWDGMYVMHELLDTAADSCVDSAADSQNVSDDSDGPHVT